MSAGLNCQIYQFVYVSVKIVQVRVCYFTRVEKLLFKHKYFAFYIEFKKSPKEIKEKSIYQNLARRA
jgi:hypothetical protein